MQGKTILKFYCPVTLTVKQIVIIMYYGMTKMINTDYI
jgi:hypothetical protein